jgi:hypothetical protein
VEPTKITPTQITSGSQYLRKDFIPNVRREIGDQQKQMPNIQHRTSNVQWVQRKGIELFN